ncbi:MULTISPECIES: YegP family protein [Lysobacter]|uniref:YegP family protein n=1 Tax=Lysobacter TaxID=68 RepID=UPI000894B0AE|nr:MULTISPECIES: YegP family protein [Lysobacter]UZW60280.1 YegP family protein [Lysobacter enzymogenes]SDZ17418.1 protein of unknown function [Lysobacter sp. yr284]
MAGKPHFEIYREGLKVGETEFGVNALLVAGTSRTHGQWRWRLVGGNGEPMAYGEAYTTRAAMMETLEAIVSLGPTEFREVNGR